MEDEIQLALGVRDLALAAERYRVRMARAILGVGGTEMIALGTVRIDGPQTPSQLARKLGITTASTTELLDRLQQAGLVERRPHPSDRRKLLVTLTPTAEQAVTAIYRHLDRVLAGVADLDPAGRQGVINFLHAAASALHNAGITSDGQLQPPSPEGQNSSAVDSHGLDAVLTLRPEARTLTAPRRSYLAPGRSFGSS